MSYETREHIICDTCGEVFAVSITLDFGMATTAVMERLTRQAIERGWVYQSSTSEIGRRSTPARHYCPDCKAVVRSAYCAS